MPIYEYQCKKCGHKFEQLQKITEKPLRVCPQCKKTALEKLVSNTSFQLKGTGWYVTDFRDKNQGNNKEDKKENNKDDKKTESTGGNNGQQSAADKQEAKPAEKPKNTEKK